MSHGRRFSPSYQPSSQAGVDTGLEGGKPHDGGMLTDRTKPPFME